MPGITLDDIANENVIDAEFKEMGTPTEFGDYEVQKENKAGEMFNRILTAETGEGSIGDYIEHPLNFSNSKSLAMIIRGMTGILGNLNLAVIDIIFGLLRYSKERKGAGIIDVHGRGNRIT
jgi:hypothetical protein